MKHEEFIELVKQMREAQDKVTNTFNLRLSNRIKELERRVDRTIKEFLDKQGKLF